MKNQNIIICALLSFASLFSSCKDAEYLPMDDQIFIAQTHTRSNISKKLIIGEDEISTELNARIPSPIKRDLSVEFQIDSNALEVFNKRNGTSYISLSEKNFKFTSYKSIIPKGKVLSAPIKLTINPLTEEMKNSGKKYALALKVVTPEGNTLQGANTIVYILDQVVITSVPIINSENNLKMIMRKDYELTQWTVEYCVNLSALGTEIGQMNNQTMLGAWGADGKDGEIYSRFGDAPIEGNRFQIKTQGTQMNSNQLFNTNTWYHIAMVSTGKKLYLYVNGVLDNSMDLPNKVVNIGKEKIQFGNQDYLKADVQLSELRFWTVARNQSEIINNLYSVDPQSTGLEAYWKLNEGKGNSFKDYTGNENKCESKGTTQWIHKVRIDGK